MWMIRIKGEEADLYLTGIRNGKTMWIGDRQSEKIKLFESEEKAKAVSGLIMMSTSEELKAEAILQ